MKESQSFFGFPTLDRFRRLSKVYTGFHRFKVFNGFCFKRITKFSNFPDLHVTSRDELKKARSKHICNETCF